MVSELDLDRLERQVALYLAGPTCFCSCVHCGLCQSWVKTKNAVAEALPLLIKAARDRERLRALLSTVPVEFDPEP